MQLFSVTTPATTLDLLTFEELEAAVGGVAADGSQDDALEAAGRRAAAAIARACRVVSDGVLPPTLLRETCQEIFWPGCGVLYLSRRPVRQINSVTVEGAAQTSDYYTFSPAGAFYYLSSGSISTWGGGKVIASYDAGFDDAPDDLKLAASKMVASIWGDSTRDAGLKRVSVDGIGEREYFYEASSDSLIPPDVMDLLEPYMGPMVI